MSVFTVYFCGTGSHRFDDKNPNFWNGELVSTLASNDQGREFADWIVVDGPGSGNQQDDQLFVESGSYHQVIGQLLGKGWDENVLHALQIIKGKTAWQRRKLTDQEYESLKRNGVPIPDKSATGSWFWRTHEHGDRKVTPQALQEQIIKQFRKPVIPTSVNLVGWSRGGISCHMLANAMAQDPELQHVPVNIFAIDPVPGIANVQLERLQLGANVKTYVGFYARDERSKGFACVVPVTAYGTQVSVFPLPGRHATLVGNASLDGAGSGKALPESGLVVRHFAEVCLKRWGVKLQKCLQLDDATLMKYHQGMLQAAEQYVDMRKQSYTVVTEGTVDDRFVHLGGVGTDFSKVCGDGFQPSEGLGLDRWTLDSYKALR